MVGYHAGTDSHNYQGSGSEGALGEGKGRGERWVRQIGFSDETNQADSAVLNWENCNTLRPQRLKEVKTGPAR